MSSQQQQRRQRSHRANKENVEQVNINVTIPLSHLMAHMHPVHKSDCHESSALSNHRSFPPFRGLKPIDMFAKGNDHRGVMEMIGTPDHHYALLAQIVSVDQSAHTSRAKCRTRFDDTLEIHCYHEDRNTNTVRGAPLKVGHTYAVLYAQRKCMYMLSMQIEEVVSWARYCYVFGAPLPQMQQQAAKLLANADLESEKKPLICFGCKRMSAASGEFKLSNCSTCKLAKYCSRECQVDDWKKAHRGICKHSDVLLRLACLPRHGDFTKESKCFTFYEENADTAVNAYLPAYVYNAKFVQQD